MGSFMKAIIPQHDDSFAGQAMLPPQSLKPRKGRGAVSNLQGRHEVHGREGFDDGWSLPDDDGDATAAPWKTQVSDEQARTILSRNTSPDLPFGVSLNPYRGCEHGCIYCFARPTHSYLGLSPGLDFESRLVRQGQCARTAAARTGQARLCRPKRLRWASTPTPTSPASASGNITRRCWRCCTNATIRSA